MSKFLNHWTALFALLSVASQLAAQDVEIVNINVGQGDATLILGPQPASGNRVAVLFDAGNIRNPDGGDRVAAVLAQRNVRRLDFVIVSHYDTDHIGGIIAGDVHGRSFILGADQAPGRPGDDDGDGAADWLEQPTFYKPDPEELGTGDDITVDRFVDRGDESRPNTQSYWKYRGMAEAQARRTSLTDRAFLEQFAIDLGGGARVLALAAHGFVRGRPDRVSQVNTENERSVSVLLTYGQFDFLLSGDMIGRTAGSENARVEAAVADWLRANNVSVDVLHADHHGADNGSASEFLEAVRPEVVIVSAGNRNTHGHPNENALQRMFAAGVQRIVQTEWGSTDRTISPEVQQAIAIYQDDIVIRATQTSYTISTTRTYPTD